jgi:hypothetical protein
MRQRSPSVALLVLMCTGIAAKTTLAHHSFAMFDKNREIFISGTVAQWNFNAPHVALVITDADGEIWNFEGRAPQSLMMSEEMPMTGYTLETGQEVDVVMCPLADGRNGGALGYIHADGQWYRPGHGGCPADRRWESEWYDAGYTSKAEAEASE